MGSDHNRPQDFQRKLNDKFMNSRIGPMRIGACNVVAARGKADPHRKKADDELRLEAKAEYPVISMDCAFTRGLEEPPEIDKEDLRLYGDVRGGIALVVTDNWCRSVLALPVPGKGRAHAKYLAEQIIRYISACGFSTCIVKADAEPAAKSWILWPKHDRSLDSRALWSWWALMTHRAMEESQVHLFHHNLHQHFEQRKELNGKLTDNELSNKEPNLKLKLVISGQAGPINDEAASDPISTTSSSQSGAPSIDDDMVLDGEGGIDVSPKRGGEPVEDEAQSPVKSLRTSACRKAPRFGGEQATSTASALGSNQPQAEGDVQARMVFSGVLLEDGDLDLEFPEDLFNVKSIKTEIERLLEMGVLVSAGGVDLEKFEKLSTHFLMDWTGGGKKTNGRGEHVLWPGTMLGLTQTELILSFQLVIRISYD
eukprot:s444_g61.t1